MKRESEWDQYQPSFDHMSPEERSHFAVAQKAIERLKVDTEIGADEWYSYAKALHYFWGFLPCKTDAAVEIAKEVANTVSQRNTYPVVADCFECGLAFRISTSLAWAIGRGMNDNNLDTVFAFAGPEFHPALAEKALDGLIDAWTAEMDVRLATDDVFASGVESFVETCSSAGADPADFAKDAAEKGENLGTLVSQTK